MTEEVNEILNVLFKDGNMKNQENIQSVTIGYESFHVGACGFGETIVKPKITITFKNQPQDLSQHPIPKDTSELNDLKVTDTVL